MSCLSSELFVNWFGHGALDRPFIKTSSKCYSGDSQAFGPLSYGERFPIERDFTGNSRVILLRAHSCPSAIARFVIFIIVYSIQRMLRAGAWPHIFAERLKGIDPSLTDLDTPAAIIGEAPVSRVCTSVNHAFPCLILCGFAHAMSWLRPSSMVSATKRFPANEIATCNTAFLAAFAPANPIRRLLRIEAGVTKYSPSAKTLSSEIVSNCLRNGYNLSSHVRTPFTNVMRGLMSALTLANPRYFTTSIGLIQ